MSNDSAGGPFWRTKRLDEMNGAEWESLCDGCGRCCLNKLEDFDTGEIAWTDVACRLLDGTSCRCADYPDRQRHVPDCIPLDPGAVRSLSWLPPSCAYRLVAEGRDLYWWHPLLSGDAETVHQAGISVRGRTVSEVSYPVEAFEDRIVTWPGEAAEKGEPAAGSSHGRRLGAALRRRLTTRKRKSHKPVVKP